MTGGHGHVHERTDGLRARCGGPTMCAVCAHEAGLLWAEQQTAKARLDAQLMAVAHETDAATRATVTGSDTANSAMAEVREIHSSFGEELIRLINRHSIENGSNTPDFLLGEYLLDCLRLWNRTVTRREQWYGRDPGQDIAAQLGRPGARHTPSETARISAGGAGGGAVGGGSPLSVADRARLNKP